MNATTKTTERKRLVSRTYSMRQSGRGCTEFGPHEIVYRDTIHDTGLIEYTARGYCDGETVNGNSTMRTMAMDAMKWETIHKSRVAAGWTLVAEMHSCSECYQDLPDSAPDCVCDFLQR